MKMLTVGMSSPPTAEMTCSPPAFCTIIPAMQPIRKLFSFVANVRPWTLSGVATFFSVSVNGGAITE
jgi:hypothetical protein